jgi:hypothetical protein
MLASRVCGQVFLFGSALLAACGGSSAAHGDGGFPFDAGVVPADADVRDFGALTGDLGAPDASASPAPVAFELVLAARARARVDLARMSDSHRLSVGVRALEDDADKLSVGAPEMQLAIVAGRRATVRGALGSSVRATVCSVEAERGGVVVVPRPDRSTRRSRPRARSTTSGACMDRVGRHQRRRRPSRSIRSRTERG